MSIQAMTYVWKESRQKGAALLLLLAIADSANGEDWSCYPGVPYLARKVRLGERYVQLLVRKLEEDGELFVDAYKGREVNGGWTNRYYVLDSGHIHGEDEGVVKQGSPGVVNNNSPRGVKQDSPNPLEEPLGESKNSRTSSTSGAGGYATGRGAQPPTGNTTTGSNDEKPKGYSPLASFILFTTKKSSMTEALKAQLAREVVNFADVNNPTMPSPDTLYETNEAFKEYVQIRVTRLMNASQGKLSLSKLIKMLCNYSYPNTGWIAYAANNGVLPDMGDDWDDDGEPDKPKESVKGGYVPGQDS